MKVTATPAQKRLIATAVEHTHGVIVFPVSYSAWEQIKMTDRMTANGLLHPGTTQVTSLAVRAAAAEVLEAAHAAALEADPSAGPMNWAFRIVKSGDIITYRTFSNRSEKWVTRRVRVIDPYIYQGRLRVKGVLVNKDGRNARVQPRHGVWDAIEAHQLIAVRHGR
jgi:hypothetical protein